VRRLRNDLACNSTLPNDTPRYCASKDIRNTLISILPLIWKQSGNGSIIIIIIIIIITTGAEIQRRNILESSHK
jgi:hypothetical protein